LSLTEGGVDFETDLRNAASEVLSQWLDEAIRGNIDIDAYNIEVESQAADVAKIRATRKATLEVIRSTEDDDEQL
jgi:hypothetical protein